MNEENLEIGRVLDTLIAVKVFKFKDIHSSNYVRPYSSNIEADFEVVDFMQKNHFRGVLSLFSPCEDKDTWGDYFAKKWPLTEYLSMDIESGETAAHAICLAALAAVSKE